MKGSEEHPVRGTFKQNMAFRSELKAMEFNKASTGSFFDLYREVDILLFVFLQVYRMEGHVPKSQVQPCALTPHGIIQP